MFVLNSDIILSYYTEVSRQKFIKLFQSTTQCNQYTFKPKTVGSSLLVSVSQALISGEVNRHDSLYYL